MIRFIHLSDVHIGLGFQSASFSETLSSKRAFEIKQTFFRALHYAKNEDIDFVIISGDLFEHEQVKKQELEEIVNMFKDTNKDIFMITGNHDPLKNQSFWHGLDFPLLTGETPYEDRETQLARLAAGVRLQTS